ncbi:ABC transporter permease [Bacillus atrophaeus]|uniref:ABC transporter permease n=1 Tax=Bacillus atrophaeus TaxID=1452 RepID=UPI001EFA8BB8|nr:ABC transporter permease [Bacillus atrophaeus]MCG8397253.1 ABC transporter permease [Bacillus atrophaeus]
MKQRVAILMYLCIPFFVISFIVTLYSHYLTDQQRVERISNSLYSNDSVYVEITTNRQEPFNWNCFDDQKEYTIFKEASDGDTKVRGFFSKGAIEKPPILEGRFFKASDFYKHKKVAVVGKAIKDKEYVLYEGEKYRIIGRMGLDKPTPLDQQTLINIDALEESKEGSTNYYVIDDYSSMKNIKNQLHNMLGKKTAINIKDKEEKGLNRVMGTDKQNQFVFYILLCVVALTSSFISVYWIHRKTMLITIQQLIGFQQRKILKSLILQYLVASQLFYLLGLLTGKLVLPFSAAQTNIIILSYIIATAFGLGSFLVAFKKKSYENIIKRLR